MQKAILSTLIYADLFDFPLTKNELWQRLIASTSINTPGAGFDSPGVKDLKKNFELRLAKLLESKKVEKQGQFYFLPGRKNIVGLRKVRAKWSREKLKKANKIVSLLKIVPFVKLVAVTGSVASGNAKKDDDIDLFIITSGGIVWMTRFLVTILTILTGVRRFPGQKNVEDKVCLNLFLAEDHLDAFAKKGDLFLAYEIAQLKLLWQREGVYQQFLSANKWAINFLPNFSEREIVVVKNTSDGCPVKKGLPLRLAALVEDLFYRFQLRWMEKKKTIEMTKPHLIAFHPRDDRSRILKRFGRAIKHL